MTRHSLAFLLFTWIALAGPASAQRSFEDDRFTGGSRREDPAANGGERNVAGEFDYYALVLSWSPTYCAENDRDDFDLQCDRTDGRRYAFVLHGLWPQYERGYPERCWTRKKPYVPQPLIDNMLDIMPSPKLVIHEFRKHGTCTGLDAASYYALSRKLFRQIEIPSRFVNPFEPQFISPGDLEEELADANPGLSPEMMSVVCGGAGNRLKEVRICFTKDGALRSCGHNEEQRRLCNAPRMYVPPVRSSRVDLDSREDRERATKSANPRPKLIEGVTGR